MDPKDITREIFWNVPAWSRWLMYILFAAALAVFVRGMLPVVRSWRKGERSMPSPPLRKVLANVFRRAILQSDVWRRPIAGASHALVVWGFVVLFIGTCIVAIEDYGSAIAGARPLFFYGDFYLVVSALLEVFGIAFLVGLLIALFRRFGPRDARPLSRPIDQALIALFLVIGVTGFATEGLRIAGARGGIDAVPFESWSFVGWSIARGVSAWDPSVIAGFHLAIWNVHMVLSMAFIAILPYSKLRHLLVAPFHVATADRRLPHRLSAVSLEEVEESGTYGARSARDFSPEERRSFQACTECARCQNACPAHATGKPLSPMRIVLDVAAAARSVPAGANEAPSLHDGVVPAAALWACTNCAACVAECPVLIDPLGAIGEMRRFLVGEGEVRGGAQAALRSISASGNPWGLPASERFDWAEGLDVPTLEEEPEPELLLWVGCAGSFDRRRQKVTRAVVTLLRHTGVRFAVLGKSERCTGDPARRLGDEFTFLEVAAHNAELLARSSVRRVLTTCPHCMHSLKNEYPSLDRECEILHHSQWIAAKIADGSLDLATEERRIAYHDACYLGRHGGEYEAPRSALAATGANVVEPAETRERGFCCGAGGGRMFLEEEGTRVNEERWRQLAATQPDAVAVSCPFCMTMLRDAAKAGESEVDVLDVAEVVAERLSNRED